MDITFEYRDIISQTKMLSAFEGKDYVNANGESMFIDVIITEQDEPLIKTYINLAAIALFERFERMITSIKEDDDSFTWSIRIEETRYPKAQISNLTKHIKESIVSYTMMNWLAEKKPDRVAMYSELWNGSVQLAAKNIFKKAAPRKRKINHTDIDELTIKVVCEEE